MNDDLHVLLLLMRQPVPGWRGQILKVALRVPRTVADQLGISDQLYPEEWKKLKTLMPLHWQSMPIVGAETLFDIHAYTKGAP